MIVTLQQAMVAIQHNQVRAKFIQVGHRECNVQELWEEESSPCYVLFEHYVDYVLW